MVTTLTELDVELVDIETAVDEATAVEVALELVNELVELLPDVVVVVLDPVLTAIYAPPATTTITTIAMIAIIVLFNISCHVFVFTTCFSH